MSRIISISAAAAKRPEGELSKTGDPAFDRRGDAAGVSDLTVDETPVNILIVDDEAKNLVVLETILDDSGYRLVRAESAEQALLALLAEEFALLILDIRMPGVSGFELARMVKARRKTAAVPIIFLTAYYFYCVINSFYERSVGNKGIETVASPRRAPT